MNALPEIASTYFSQWDPDHVGTGDCVPTSAKMLLRWYTGQEIEIATLRDEMDLAPDGERDLAKNAGITLEACRAVLTQHGVGSIAIYARDMSYDGLVDCVQQGRLPIIFIEYARITNRMDLGFPSGALHAVWLAGVDGDQAWLKDPDRWGPSKADAFYTRPGELRDAWDAGAALGGGAIIPNEPREGWADDMFTDEDRRRLGVIFEALSPGDDGKSVFTKTNDAVETLVVTQARLQRNIDVERGGADGSFDPAQPPVDPRVRTP